jgi:hypothetical protein
VLCGTAAHGAITELLPLELELVPIKPGCDLAILGAAQA